MKIITLIVVATVLVSANASFSSYFEQLGKYFGYSETAELEAHDLYTKRIPYEVSTADEKFITEAAQLTGVALSELDSCQQAVVLKLQSDCHKMNDEQLAKMAVHLLNCQSYVEGRTTYPCTDEMSIKDCTTRMDSDTWTSYHLMSNRARAVCYTIRQTQFRGLAEQTVNKLMNTAQSQLALLGKIEKEQENIQTLAENTFDLVEKGHDKILDQQQDIQKAQFHSHLTLEDNIRRLIDEKRLISESHQELAFMTHTMQKKLELAAKEIEAQTGQSRENHQELLDDIIAIQNKAQIIYQKIEDSAELLLKQTEIARRQYEETLLQLAEVNKTVNGLVDLVTGTKRALEEKLFWLSTSLGGTDLALERLSAIVWHLMLLLVSMIACAFLGASTNIRFIVAALPPVNLALALNESENAVGPFTLTLLIVSSCLVQIVISYLVRFYSSKTPLYLSWKKASPMTEKNSSPQKTDLDSHFETSYEGKSYRLEDFEDYGRSTPPPSSQSYHSRSRSQTPLRLNGTLKHGCKAKTRLGTPCKITSLPGRDYCFRHQTGDSVML